MLYQILNSNQTIITNFKNLVPHDLINQNITEIEAEVTKNLKKLKITDRRMYKYFKNKLTNQDLILYIMKIERNAFDFREAGPAILFSGTLLNHSCLPNVIFGKSGRQMHFVTCRYIKAGEELSDSYIDISKNTDSRKLELLTNYGFNCTCERCNYLNEDKYVNIIKKIEKMKFDLFGYCKSM